MLALVCSVTVLCSVSSASIDFNERSWVKCGCAISSSFSSLSVFPSLLWSASSLPLSPSGRFLFSSLFSSLLSSLRPLVCSVVFVLEFSSLCPLSSFSLSPCFSSSTFVSFSFSPGVWAETEGDEGGGEAAAEAVAVVVAAVVSDVVSFACAAVRLYKYETLSITSRRRTYA